VPHLNPQRKPPAWRRYLQFWGANANRDIDDELRFHIEMRAAEYVRAGIDPGEAHRRAEERFGSMARAREECLVIHDYAARREGRAQMLMTLVQDAAYALRVLRRQWIPSLAAMLCMAIGVSATAGMFSIAERLLLRPLPYPNGDRLVTVSTAKGDDHASVSSYLDYLDWNAAQHSFTDLAALGQTDFIMLRGSARRVSSALVSANFFRAFGVTVKVGRSFEDSDDQAGAPAVVIVSDAFAHNEFGDARHALGQPILMNGAQRTIIGVIRDDWRYPSRVEAWLPIQTGGYSAAARKESDRGNRNLEVFGTLRPGVTVDMARKDLAAIAARLAREHPTSDGDVTTSISPLRERFIGSARPALTAMIVATLLVLLIACANVAALQLARSSVRVREIAVRVAIGAGRGRILRQLLTESIVLAILGGAAGVVLTIWSRPLLAHAVLSGTPAWMTFDIDWRVVAFALGVSMLSGMLVGLTPALSLGKLSALEALRGGAASTGGHNRVQRAFVVAEVAISITLIVGASLALESVARIRRIPLGIDPTDVVIFDAAIQGPRYDDPHARAAFVATVSERLRALPGALAAGGADRPPIIGCCSRFGTEIEGQPTAAGHQRMITGTIATPGYFDALGIQRVAGRTFGASDDNGAPLVTVINETFAAKYWPHGDAIGHHINTGIGDARIIGIVRDIKQNGLLDGPTPQFFRPYAQDPWTRITFMLRTRGDTAAIVTAARHVLHDVDPTVPMFNVSSMTALLDQVTTSSRNFRNLLTTFATIALLLAAAGLYGLMAFIVERRRRELGLRVALGAEPAAVAAMVMRQATALAATGVALGLLGAALASRWLVSSLWGVDGHSLPIYAVAAIVLGLTTLGAAFGPARRASRVDPMLALRNE
jgi:putative ABC transport system permease protein